MNPLVKVEEDAIMEMPLETEAGRSSRVIVDDLVAVMFLMTLSVWTLPAWLLIFFEGNTQPKVKRLVPTTGWMM